MADEIFNAVEAVLVTDNREIAMTLKGQEGDAPMLTSLSGDGQTNIQIDYPFNGDMLVTQFGDKLTEARLEGIFVPSPCALIGTTDNLLAFYTKYRAGNKGKDPTVFDITVSSTATTFQGLLVRMGVRPVAIPDGGEYYMCTLFFLGKYITNDAG